jgi:hypothetical protein
MTPRSCTGSCGRIAEALGIAIDTQGFSAGEQLPNQLAITLIEITAGSTY